MLDGFADNPVVRQTVAEARTRSAWTSAKLIAEGPKEELDLTTNTQPVMLTAGVAVLPRLARRRRRVPAVVAGHSLGEYSALVAAGALAFADAVPLVRFRAQAMQEAVPVGQGAHGRHPRASTTGGARRLRRGAREGEVVEAVNFNEPTQIVIAGTQGGASSKACEAAQGGRRQARDAAAGVGAVPFRLLKPAAERLREYMATTAVHRAADPPDQQRRCRRRRTIRPRSGTRWCARPSARCAGSRRCRRSRPRRTQVVECGPGKVLTGMAKRIDAELVRATRSSTRRRSSRT